MNKEPNIRPKFSFRIPEFEDAMKSCTAGRIIKQCYQLDSVKQYGAILP